MPLTGLKVLDLCRARAGPTAVRQLADWGADVIKIELPESAGTDPLARGRDGFDFQNLHRNKRSLGLNLKLPRGRELFLELARGADVVVENFRPDVKHRLGIDYETVSAVNPRIVYGSISGFGQEGPYAGRAGLDQGPVRVGIPIADLSAGFQLAMGIMMALYERHHSGKGQWVHTSLLEANMAMMDFQAARYLKDGEVPGQAGNNHPTSIPTGVFATTDAPVNIQASADHLFRRLCTTLGCIELTGDPRFATPTARQTNRDELNGELEARTREWNSVDLVNALAEAGVPCGPIYSVDQTFADPQVQTLAMDPAFQHPRLGTLRLLGQAVNMSRTPEHVDRPTPDLGQHTGEILEEMGYTAQDIAALRAEKVV